MLPRIIERGTTEAAFSRLIQRGNEVTSALGSAQEQVDLAWPTEALLGYDGGMLGYFMPALAEAFILDVPGQGKAVRALGAANGLAGRQDQGLTAAELVDLVRAVAVWLRALHAAGVVHGDLGFRSLAYTTSPVRIRVLDYDTARIVGRTGLLPPDLAADHDPLTPRGETSYDSDRFLFAELAFRLMVTRNDHGEIDPEALPSRLLGLAPRHTSRLQVLWQRATGPRGTRPTMDEWVHGL